MKKAIALEDLLLKPPFTYIEKSFQICDQDRSILWGSTKEPEDFFVWVVKALNEKWKREFKRPVGQYCHDCVHIGVRDNNGWEYCKKYGSCYGGYIDGSDKLTRLDECIEEYGVNRVRQELIEEPEYKPFVVPEPKRWIIKVAELDNNGNTYTYAECPECGFEHMSHKFNYCPSCGQKLLP